MVWCCVAVFVNYGLLFVSPAWVCELLGLLQRWKPAGRWNRTGTQDGTMVERQRSKKWNSSYYLDKIEQVTS